MDNYADSFGNEFGISTYELYDGGYTTVVDIRLDSPVCGVITDFDVNSLVNTYPISILSLFSGGLLNTEVQITGSIYANGLTFITESASSEEPLTLSKVNNYVVDGFNISVMICFQEHGSKDSSIMLFKYGIFEIYRDGLKVYVKMSHYTQNDTMIEYLSLPDIDHLNYFVRYVLFVNVKYDGLASSGNHHYSIRFHIQGIPL